MQMRSVGQYSLFGSANRRRWTNTSGNQAQMNTSASNIPRYTLPQRLRGNRQVHRLIDLSVWGRWDVIHHGCGKHFTTTWTAQESGTP